MSMDSRAIRWAAVFASVALHLVLLFFPPFRDDASDLAEAQTDHSRSTKVRIKVAAARPSGPASVRKARVARAPGGGRKVHGFGTMTYADLVGVRDVMGESAPTASQGVLTGAESLQRDASSHGPVQDFAEDFQSRIDIPLKLYELQKSGKSSAILRRLADGKWRAEVRGDAYTKVILAKAIEEMSPDGFGWQQLSLVQHDFLLLDFDFLVRPSNALDQRPFTLAIKGNRISLSRYHYEIPKEWEIPQKLVMVLDPASATLNLVGLGQLVYEAVSKKPDPAVAAEIVRLKLAPAFTKPIYSIDLP
jgi:hypothetical protein